MASGTITNQFGKRSKSYTGTTDAHGNLEIPTTIINANKEFAIPMYSTNAYVAGTTFISGQIYVKLVRYDGTALANANTTVYFLV